MADTATSIARERAKKRAAAARERAHKYAEQARRRQMKVKRKKKGVFDWIRDYTSYTKK